MELTIEQTLQQAIAAHKEGKLQEAERLYRTILQSQPLHPDANHNLGLLAVSVNKADAALPLFKTALEANPKIEQFWISHIDALVKNNQLKDAKQAIKKAKKKGFDAKKLQVLLSQSKGVTDNEVPPQELLNSLLEQYQNGQYGDAEKLASSISQDFPKHQIAWKVLGAIFTATGRDSEAVNAYQTAVVLSSQDAEAHNNLGATLQTLGRLDESEASYTKAIALKPDYVNAHNNLGITLQKLGRLDEAEASYIQAIALKPDYAEAHSNLGNTHKELGRLDEAKASYTQAIALKPDYELAHYNLGVTLQELGRLDEAEASYTQAIALKHNYPDALFNRWHLLFDKGEFDAALKDSDLDIYVGAKEHSLITLYALGRIEEVYKKIEIHSKMDSENIGISAFAAFVAESEKKPTAYNFCPNPIDFIHVSNISSHLEDSTEFVREVIEELHNVKTIWEPFGKATRKGFVTDKKFNLFASSSGKLAQLKAIIFDEIDAYYLKFQEESCTYIKKWPSEISLFGWHIVLKQQGYNTPHIHPSGWLSGVIYLKVVPSLGKDEGAIEFSLNGEHYSDLNSPKIVHQPELGDLVFFPSSLHHRTIPFTTDTDRIIVSFDLMPPNFVG